MCQCDSKVMFIFTHSKSCKNLLLNKSISLTLTSLISKYVYIHLDKFILPYTTSFKTAFHSYEICVTCTDIHTHSHSHTFTHTCILTLPVNSTYFKRKNTFNSKICLYSSYDFKELYKPLPFREYLFIVLNVQPLKCPVFAE